MSHRDDRDCFDETGHRRESGLTSTAERLTVKEAGPMLVQGRVNQRLEKR